MTPELIRALEARQEKLGWNSLEEFDEADRTIDKGDRFWCKKNAAAGLTCMTKINSILERVQGAGDDMTEEEQADIEEELIKAERESMAVLEESKRLRVVE